MRISGTARVGRRTKHLVHALSPGDIAVISHTDLDAPCATELVARRVAAVVNAQRSLSGRFPHPGPGILLAAGIPLIDDAGERLLGRVREGEHLEIVDGAVYSDGELIATGRLLTADEVERRNREAQQHLTAEFGRFVENTMSYVAREHDMLFETPQMPELRTKIDGRHCLVAVRGPDAARDVRAVRSYVTGLHPVLIGVDGGADLLVREGHRPDIILGDMDSVSDAALRSGAEIVVHSYPNGDAPGRERLDAMGLPYVILPARGTSEDVAMLLAYEKGAELIAAVGTHFSLTEFLEKARGGMSSTFLVRLKVGSILVDAKGISRLYPSSPPMRLLIYLCLVAAVMMGVVLTTSPEIRATLDLWLLRLHSFLQVLGR